MPNLALNFILTYNKVNLWEPFFLPPLFLLETLGDLNKRLKKSLSFQPVQWQKTADPAVGKVKLYELVT
jgi:hypothetical protein